MDTSMMPIAGIDNISDDASLQVGGKAPKLYVREALNVDISAAGKIALRGSPRRVSDMLFRNVWVSPLHGDTFGTLGNDWVLIDPAGWSYTVLASVGEGEASHCVLNSQVCVAAPAGVFTFDGSTVERLTLENPGPPLVVSGDSGSLVAGTYGVAVAWLRGKQESATSPATFVEVPAQGNLAVTFPMCLDDSVTGIRLYLTEADGGLLQVAGDWPGSVGMLTVEIPLLPDLGRPAQFRNFVPMPTGKYLRYWNGRILTASANVLRWSEAMTYHVHDDLHGFLQMPQRITFVEPVDGGIWVGQVDHVAFLAGASPEDFTLTRKGGRPPVPGSSAMVTADMLSPDVAQGANSAMWLAENGYVVGTSAGVLFEMQSQHLGGITAKSGSTVILDTSLVTAVV